MRKIVFISDFFVDQVSGGAEIYDNILIEELTKKDYKVCKFNSQEFTVKHFKLFPTLLACQMTLKNSCKPMEINTVS